MSFTLCTVKEALATNRVVGSGRRGSVGLVVSAGVECGG